MEKREAPLLGSKLKESQDLALWHKKKMNKMTFCFKRALEQMSQIISLLDNLETRCFFCKSTIFQTDLMEIDLIFPQFQHFGLHSACQKLARMISCIPEAWKNLNIWDGAKHSNHHHISFKPLPHFVLQTRLSFPL